MSLICYKDSKVIPYIIGEKENGSQDTATEIYHGINDEALKETQDISTSASDTLCSM
jgi:hypothetical protein